MIRIHRPQFLKGTLGVTIVAGALLLIGGGVVFAKLGGVPTLSSTSDISLQKGLVGWWPMNGNAKDATPYAHNGTVTGATLVADRKSQANKAYSFNGTSNYITVANNSTLSLTGAMSISIWVNITNNSNYQPIVSKGSPGEYELGADFRSGATTLSFKDTAGTENATGFFTGYTGTWIHIVIATDGSHDYFYRNGSLITTTSAGTATTTSNDVVFGKRGTFYYSGLMSDVRIYNRALSATEVTALSQEYNSTIKTNSGENGLVGQWKMAGNLNDATPNTTVCSPQFFTPTFVADQAGRAGSALSFVSGKLGATCGQPMALRVANVTMSAWVKPTSWNSSSNGIESYGGIVQFYFTSSGFLRFQVHDSSNVTHTFTSPSAYATGTWYYVAATYDGTTVNLYVNGGASVLNTSYTGGIGTNHYGDSGNNFLLANDGSDSTTDGFIGALDDIRIYNRALSPTEISNLYNSYNSQISLGGDGLSGGINLQKGLVSYWSLNGNMKDATPYSNNGTIQGTITATTDRKGRASSAYSFNGSTGYISTTNSFNNPNVFSINAWMKTTTASGGVLVAADNAQTGFPGHGARELYMGNDGEIYFFVYNSSGGTTNTINTSTGYNDGKWHMVTAMMSSTGMVLYVDGTQVGTNANTGAQPDTVWWRIGDGRACGTAVPDQPLSCYLAGSIDDVRIYNRALSPTEVQALYQGYQ